MKLLRRLRALFRMDKLDAEMAEEMRQHVELQAERNRKAGLDTEEARYAAERQFGNVASVQERVREARPWASFEHFGRDLQFGIRSLRNSPVFTVVVVAVFALGIGANSTVFAIVDALLLRPLPVTAPDRLFVAAATGPLDTHKRFPYSLFDRSGTNLPMPYAFLEAFRADCQTAEVAAVTGWTVMRPLAGPGDDGHEAESVNIEEVSGNYFALLGVTATLGRTLTAEDDQPGHAAPVAVLNHEYWRERFNADPAILGKVLRLDNFPLTIVGVAAPKFSGARVGNAVAFWVPINLSSQIDANAPWGTAGLASATTPLINILVRPHVGVSAEQARADLDLIYQRKLVQMDPQRAALATAAAAGSHQLEQRLALLPAGRGYAGLRTTFRQPASILLALVGFMQLVACANVAGLLMARGVQRQGEFALRAALGATRGRLIRQMLTESLLLAAIAGTIGLLLAEGGTRILGHAVMGVRLWANWRIVAFTCGITLLTGLLVGLVPGWRLSREQLVVAIKATSGRSRQWLNPLLVVAQVSLALLLLVVAGLFTRTLHNLVHADLGFQPRQRLLFDLNLPPAYKAGQRLALDQKVVDAIEALPGVENASLYQGFEMLGDTSFVLAFSAEGYAPAPGEELRASLGRVGPHFLATMGIPIIRGRDFGPADEATSAGVAPLIVSEWSAHRLFGQTDPLGRHIKMGGDFEIVGVVRDVIYRSIREKAGYVFYMPLRIWPNEYRVTFVVQTRGLTSVPASELNRAVQGIDAGARISSLRTIAERLDQNLSRDRLIARLAEFFGALALVFAGIGLFGLMSFTVSRRTKEFGVRLALGATPGDILTAVTRHGMLLALVGSGTGMAGAWGLTRFVGSQLYGVPSTDPVTFVVAALVLMLIALLASALPARRAAKVDPVIALRAE